MELKRRTVLDEIPPVLMRVAQSCSAMRGILYVIRKSRILKIFWITGAPSQAAQPKD